MGTRKKENKNTLYYTEHNGVKCAKWSMTLKEMIVTLNHKDMIEKMANVKIVVDL